MQLLWQNSSFFIEIENLIVTYILFLLYIYHKSKKYLLHIKVMKIEELKLYVTGQGKLELKLVIPAEVFVKKKKIMISNFLSSLKCEPQILEWYSMPWCEIFIRNFSRNNITWDIIWKKKKYS